jgi:hypothetical protein
MQIYPPPKAKRSYFHFTEFEKWFNCSKIEQLQINSSTMTKTKHLCLNFESKRIKNKTSTDSKRKWNADLHGLY